MPEDNTTIKRPCNFCGEKGRVGEDGFDGNDITCPVCQGAGSLLLDSSTSMHPLCEGRGKIKMRGPFGKQMVLCPDCHGTGWY